jgi:hypothetical protein
LAEELGKRRSAIIERRTAHETSFAELSDDREIELEERAQEDRIALGEPLGSIFQSPHPTSGHFFLMPAVQLNRELGSRRGA